MANLAIIILTHNEAIHLDRALRLAKQVSNEIFVVDSYSTDETTDIAARHGATVLHHGFVNYAKQFQWALDNAPIRADWVMRLDADEEIEEDLQVEINERLAKLPQDVVGVNLKRKHIFMGKWIKHGGRYPLTMLRIWRNGSGRIEDRWMDEHMVVSAGKVVTFNGGFADHNLNNLTFFTEKHNKYATREAIDVLNQRIRFTNLDAALSSETSSLQAATKRVIKERIYNRIPFQISAILYFLYRIVFQLGFLDGKEGFIYHFLQGLWYRFLVGAKVEELQRALNGLTEHEEIRQKLSQLTKLEISAPRPRQ